MVDRTSRFLLAVSFRIFYQKKFACNVSSGSVGRESLKHDPDQTAHIHTLTRLLAV